MMDNDEDVRSAIDGVDASNLNFISRSLKISIYLAVVPTLDKFITLLYNTLNLYLLSKFNADTKVSGAVTSARKSAAV